MITVGGLFPQVLSLVNRNAFGRAVRKRDVPERGNILRDKDIAFTGYEARRIAGAGIAPNRGITVGRTMSKL